MFPGVSKCFSFKILSSNGTVIEPSRNKADKGDAQADTEGGHQEGPQESLGCWGAIDTIFFQVLLQRELREREFVQGHPSTRPPEASGALSMLAPGGRGVSLVSC